MLPRGIFHFHAQVAGHIYQPGTDIVGMLRDDNDRSILKPLGKPVCGAREVHFYTTLQEADDPDLVELKKFVPRFGGIVKILLNQTEVEFIKLENLTWAMSEPCVMDIKIGKRTWDPIATPEKIISEEKKYAACKQTLGFCIPGFQVYLLDTGELKRFGKTYGKQLNEDTLKDALGLFLNLKAGLCKSLFMQILAHLHEIQKWSQKQTSVELYSSSILLIYDANRLRRILQNKNDLSVNGNGLCGKIIAPNSDDKPKYTIDDEHNFFCENKLSIEETRRSLLNPNSPDSWVKVKMIDFAHVFPSKNKTIDSNYLFGITKLIQVFERFLKTSS